MPCLTFPEGAWYEISLYGLWNETQSRATIKHQRVPLMPI